LDQQEEDDPLQEELFVIEFEGRQCMLPSNHPVIIQKDGILIGKNVKDVNLDEEQVYHIPHRKKI